MADLRNRKALETDAVNFADLLDKTPQNKPTTDKAFIEQQQERLMGPSNVVVTPKKPRTSAQFEVAEAQENVRRQEIIINERAREAQYRAQQQAVYTQQAEMAATVKKKRKATLSTTDKIRNTATAVTVVSGWGFIWSCFQLPLAIASIAFLAIGAGLKASWLGRVVSKGAEAANAVTSAFGADFSALAPTSVGLSLNFMLFGLLLLGIMGTVFAYVIRGQDPIFGGHSEAKIGALIVAVMGYSLPLINLFPWIGLYIYIMWKSPR